MDNDLNRIRRRACERIKYYRRINKLSQAAMSEKLWMSKRAYLRLETGETALTLDRLHQISKIFDISIGILIGTDKTASEEDILNEFKSLNQQYLLNEQRILDLLNELKDRI